MLPGLDGTGKLFVHFIRTVGPHVDVTVVPYPKDQVLGYRGLESLVRAALPIDRRYVLLGESFAGPNAIRIAAKPPRALAGVILCGTFAKNPYTWLRWLRPLATRLPIKSLPRRLRALFMWGSTSRGVAPAQTERAIADVTVPVVRHRLGEILSVDETRALETVTLPLLILTGRRDIIVPRRALRWLTGHAPHATIQQIDGPHLLLQSRPEACAAAIVPFLRRCL
jgi:pimeloyl-ACP methyl ester carboxylesterase